VGVHRSDGHAALCIGLESPIPRAAAGHGRATKRDETQGRRIERAVLSRRHLLDLADDEAPQGRDRAGDEADGGLYVGPENDIPNVGN
jgi:hypothetical protein